MIGYETNQRKPALFDVHQLSKIEIVVNASSLPHLESPRFSNEMGKL